MAYPAMKCRGGFEAPRPFPHEQATFPINRVRSIEELKPGSVFVQYHPVHRRGFVDYNSHLHVVLEGPFNKKRRPDDWWIKTAAIYTKDGEVDFIPEDDNSLADAGIVEYDQGGWNENGIVIIGHSDELHKKIIGYLKNDVKDHKVIQTLANRFLKEEIYNESEAIRQRFLDSLEGYDIV